MDMATGPPTSGEIALRERKKLRQRQTIVRTTIDFIQTKGFDGTNIGEVAGALEISSATFYNYFKSKEDVLSYWVQIVWERLTREVVAGHESDRPVRELLYALNARTAKLLGPDRKLWRTIAEKNAWHPAQHSSLAGTGADAHAALTALIRLGQDRGELTDSVDAARIATLLDSVLVSTCEIWALERSGRRSLAERLNESLDLFLGGAAQRHMPNAKKRRTRNESI